MDLLSFNVDEHVIPLTNSLPSCVELPLPSIFNKSVPACPFLNTKPSYKGDVDVPQLLKYVFAPLSKYILWLLNTFEFESIIQLLFGFLEVLKLSLLVNLVL